MIRIRMLALTALLAVALLLPLAQGVQAAPYYEGKMLTIVVGYGPGGGYDRMARLLAKHLGKYIPGNPSIIVENMPGAGSLIACNHLYNKAQPDGFTIGTFNRGLPFAQLLKEEGARFDMKKFAWIGSAASEGTVLIIRSELPYNSYEELKKSDEPLILGATGPTDTTTQYARMLQEVLGIKVKLINYQSSADIMLSIERKETDGRCASYNSIKPFMDRNLVKPILRGRVSEGGSDKLPIDEELTSDPKGKALLAMRSAPDAMGRPFVAPPGTPDEPMKILREAFAKVQNDPELIADSKKMDMQVEYAGPEKIMKILDFLFNQPQEIVDVFARLAK